uniref:Uncharacterized protein n=1 Tax=Udotea flabellum TaxID=170437 RepID=A0A386B1R0_9CHLO|nr:hypothetical protein [Udotea flabellum]AYC65646.1 hypothetical protein [Udotea flabellum]
MKRPWSHAYRKLLMIQKLIKHNAKKKNVRLCRNYQRLLNRNSFLQLLIINEILQENLDLLELKLSSKKYREFFRKNIVVQLWIFALSPILDNQKSLTYLKSMEVYVIFCQYLKKPFVQYVLFCKFSNFFSKKNKYWIMSNISIEKKFFLNVFTLKKMNSQKKLFSLKKIFKQLIILHFQTNFRIGKQILKVGMGGRSQRTRRRGKPSRGLTGAVDQLSRPNIGHKFTYSAKKVLCVTTNNLLSHQIKIFEYNNILLFFLQKGFKSIYLNPKTYGLNIQFIKLYLLRNGLNFLGWFFLKNANHLNVKINQKNLHSYKKEIKKYFNKNRPIDKIISNLNRKILTWKKCYSSEADYRITKINNYFFRQIWYWIKKHHRKKDIKWLYNYYWKKSTPTKWIFTINEEILIFSKIDNI